MPAKDLESLAAAIRRGKSYHLFFGKTYLESYYFPETAKNMGMIEGCRVVYLTCSKTLEEMK